MFKEWPRFSRYVYMAYRTYGVTAGDFNGDGNPDLAVVVGTNSSLLTTLLGNGDGTFANAGTSGAGTFATSATVGDFNGDGIADLAVPSRAGLTILLGRGDGTFDHPPLLPTDPATEVGVGDFTGSGLSDVAAPNSSSGITVYLNDGNWPFIPGETRHGVSWIDVGPREIAPAIWGVPGAVALASSVPVNARTVADLVPSPPASPAPEPPLALTGEGEPFVSGHSWLTADPLAPSFLTDALPTGDEFGWVSSALRARGSEWPAPGSQTATNPISG